MCHAYSWKITSFATITATATSTAMAPAITNSTLATMESNSTCCNTTITKPALESSFDSKMKLSARVEPDKQHATATRHRLTRSITNTSIHFYQKLATKIQSKKPTTNSTMSNPCNVRGPPTSV
ncbi:hypothetical protein BDF22DRAFT_298163 [Syncephalis plumigaleata]|nr:hypothetical protein BDF22DRAFT_298163 [Syncephalis plumigaleata]